jgi:hypothetical protein
MHFVLRVFFVCHSPSLLLFQCFSGETIADSIKYLCISDCARRVLRFHQSEFVGNQLHGLRAPVTGNRLIAGQTSYLGRVAADSATARTRNGPLFMCYLNQVSSFNLSHDLGSYAHAADL